MPNRILRDWTDSSRFEGISSEAERLFVRLIMKADDYGRFHADSRLLKAAAFPLEDQIRPNDLFRWLDELSTRQLILRYEVDGRAFLSIVNYGQRLKQSRPKFPAPAGKPADFLPVPADFPEVPGTVQQLPGSSGVVGGGGGDVIGGGSDAKANFQEVPGKRSEPPPTADNFTPDEQWLALLKHNFPDRDVDGELASFNAFCKHKGTAANRRGFEGWLKKASPAIRSQQKRKTLCDM